jgi:thioredoxin reductase (NADPH)
MSGGGGYDAIVVGAGPAGLTAGLYLARAGKRTLCLEQGTMGGQIVTTSHVENYPGFPEGISGKALIALFEAQARRFGLDIQPGRVDGLRVDGEMKEVSVGGFPFQAPVVVVATGLLQKLGVPGEEEYLGRGVSYCATCDGALYRERPVAVVGSTDWALEEAHFLLRFASRLYLVTRSGALSPEGDLNRELLENPRFEVVGSAKPLAVTGDRRGVTGLSVEVRGETAPREIRADGVFIFSGKRRPGTDFLRGVAELDEEGFVRVDEQCETSVTGLYAVGDVRRRHFHQVATAVGDGAVAGMDALRHLKGGRAA